MAGSGYYADVVSSAVVGKTLSLDGTVPSGGVALTAGEFAAVGPWSGYTSSGGVTTGTYPTYGTSATTAATLLAGGLAITSTGTPSLNHTYAADAQTLALMGIQAAATGSGPIGAVWPARLINGNWIDVGSSAHQLAIYGVLCTFNCCCNAIINGVAGAPTPSASATIA